MPYTHGLDHALRQSIYSQGFGKNCQGLSHPQLGGHLKPLCFAVPGAAVSLAIAVSNSLHALVVQHANDDIHGARLTSFMSASIRDLSKFKSQTRFQHSFKLVYSGLNMFFIHRTKHIDPFRQFEIYCNCLNL